MTINKERVRLWVDALRSGEFKQGKFFLERIMSDGSHEFCCLGVACRVAMAHGLELGIAEIPSKAFSYTVLAFKGEQGISDACLPSIVAWWFGLSSNEPVVFHDDGTTDALITLNDDKEWDFNQIADILEANFLADD